MNRTPSLLEAFDFQIDWCRQPAPFTARLLARSRVWLQDDPAAHAALAKLSDDPLAGAVPLRWAAALHLLALQGLTPWATLWPPARASTAGDASQDAALDAALDAAIRQAWHSQQPLLRDALSRPPQTNEVQRSAALLPGLLQVAAATGLPLVLLEIGGSAGLNLWCDRYRYEPAVAAGDPPWAWGDSAAPLCLRNVWRGPSPWPAGQAAPLLRILRRAACDAKPIDLNAPGQALRLASFIWPDQPERLARLQAAQAAVAGWLQHQGVKVEALSAADFVARELRQPKPGAATVLMHSVVWQYIGAAEQRLIEASLAQAGERASATAPLAWLRFEPPSADGKVELRCRLWPGGEDHLLAQAHPHGAQIDWCAGGSQPALRLAPQQHPPGAAP